MTPDLGGAGFTREAGLSPGALLPTPPAAQLAPGSPSLSSGWGPRPASHPHIPRHRCGSEGAGCGPVTSDAQQIFVDSLRAATRGHGGEATCQGHAVRGRGEGTGEDPGRPGPWAPSSESPSARAAPGGRARRSVPPTARTRLSALRFCRKQTKDPSLWHFLPCFLLPPSPPAPQTEG